MTGYDIAMLTFSCVSANHLGLISAVERLLRKSIPVVNCPKCFTFWAVLFTTYFSGWNMISALAVSFLSAYLSLWINLLFAFIDKQFNCIYGKILSTDNTTADGAERT